MLCSCGDTEYEYSRYPCNFVFDNAAGRSLKLSTAMNPMSPGVFCRVSTSGKYFVFLTNADNDEPERVPYNAIDAQRTIRLGAYNETGVIVGYGNLDNPAVFYAYDSQCPNCYKVANLPRYTLSMDYAGKAKCKNCGREYDMNNGGIVTGGQGGDKLIRYRGSTTGPQGVVTVVN